MALIQKSGIIATDSILNREEFVQYLTNKIKRWRSTKYITQLELIKKHIMMGEYKQAYIIWNQSILGELLGNKTPVSLLVFTNVASPERNYKTLYQKDETRVLNQTGALTQVNEVSSIVQNLNIEQQLSDHLGEFLYDLETIQVPRPINFREKIPGVSTGRLKGYYKRLYGTGKLQYKYATFKNVFYGQNPNWHGNAADAFINHLGHLHVQILAQQGVNLNKQLFSTSVFKEEKENIYALLDDSRNTVGWFTGGDLFIQYGDFVLNVQLKTKKYNLQNSISGKLAMKKLNQIITMLLEESNIENIANILYDQLKTSGWVQPVQRAITSIVNDLKAPIEKMRSKS